jgi:hypothetical protein
MAADLKDAQQRSEAATANAERARDKIQAVREYEAEKLARDANMARLRALRLAKEASDAEEKKTAKPAKKKTAKTASRTAVSSRADGGPQTST